MDIDSPSDNEVPERSSRHGDGAAGKKMMCWKYGGSALIVCSVAVGLLFSGRANAAEDGRYRAFPIAPGGPVLIIDTEEGHLWTWSTNGIEETNDLGINARIRYQGNVRKNMKTPKKSSVTEFSRSSKEDNRF